MNTTKLIAALALSFAASGAALATEAAYGVLPASASTVTRAQVQAELKQARADGSFYNFDGVNHKPDTFVAQRSRADVRAETLAAAASGELRQLNRETNSFDGTIQSPAMKADATRVAGTTSSR